MTQQSSTVAWAVASWIEVLDEPIGAANTVEEGLQDPGSGRERRPRCLVPAMLCIHVAAVSTIPDLRYRSSHPTPARFRVEIATLGK